MILLLPGVGLAAAWMIAPLAQSVPRTPTQQPVVLPKDVALRKVEMKLEGKSLAEVVAAIAPSIGRGILVDGVPILKSANLELHGTAVEALDKIGDMYDYVWSVSKTGMILMVKRFHKLEEYPQCNPREMRQFALDSLSVLSPIGSVRQDLAPALQELGASFSPAQVKYLQNGGFYRLADLSPTQQQMMLGCISSELFAQSLHALKYLSASLFHAENSQVWAGPEPTQVGGSAQLVYHYNFVFDNKGPDGRIQRISLLTNLAKPEEKK